MSLYSKTISEGKEQARKLLLNQVRQLAWRSTGTAKKFSCLTLPASNFALEKELRFMGGRVKIDTVERNPMVYGKGVRKAKELKINHHKGDVFEYLYTNLEKQYDFIWLDMCSSITPALINRLIPIFQGNHTTKKAVIGLTTMRAREHGVLKHKKHYGIQRRTLATWRSYGLYKILNFFAQQTGCKLTYSKFWYTSAKGTAMQLLIFTLKKPINSIIN